MKAHTWVERTVIDDEREPINGMRDPCSVSSRAALSPINAAQPPPHSWRSCKQARAHASELDLARSRKSTVVTVDFGGTFQKRAPVIPQSPEFCDRQVHCVTSRRCTKLTAVELCDRQTDTHFVWRGARCNKFTRTSYFVQ